MPIEICFHCNSQHLHGAIRAPFSIHSNTAYQSLLKILLPARSSTGYWQKINQSMQLELGGEFLNLSLYTDWPI